MASTELMKRVILRFKGYHKDTVNSAQRVRDVASLFWGLRVGGLVQLPLRIKKWTMIKGPFRDKKGQQTLEKRVYNRLFAMEGPSRVRIAVQACTRRVKHRARK